MRWPDDQVRMRRGVVSGWSGCCRSERGAGSSTIEWPFDPGTSARTLTCEGVIFVLISWAAYSLYQVSNIYKILVKYNML